MDFYTNVVQWGNNLLVRGVQNGQRTNFRVDYSPTLFVPVMKQTGWKTLDNKDVMPYKFDSIKDSKELLQKYESQPHLVFGYARYAYTYISDTFPNPEAAIEPLLSITVKNHQSKKIIVWGLHPYQHQNENVTYIQCGSERDLILEFMSFWTKNYLSLIHI